MAKLALKPHGAGSFPGPVALIILDGVGVGPDYPGNAVRLARTPVLDELMGGAYPQLQLRAHGVAVGLPSDGDMGNSEVGHNALGAGRVFAQGAKLVNEAIKSRALFEGQIWREQIEGCLSEDSPLHLIGLLSDGNVHSHIDHLLAMLREASAAGLRRVFVHPLLDGRDVPETSALSYVETLEATLRELEALAPQRRYRIASGGGRMRVTMDRYGADWTIVQRGWEAHVLGTARGFASATEAIETYRAELPGVIDQDLPSFTIVDEGSPVGPIEEGSSVIFFNFRGDRAIEVSRAFTEEDFDEFDRGPLPRLRYAGMMQYDGDLQLPPRFLVDPPTIDRTVSEHLAKAGVTQFAVSETQKFGHVTYFWNGNRSGMFDSSTEEYLEIPSDRVSFDERPWMKAAEIADALLEKLEGESTPRFLRCNFANGDMVGHTGSLNAAIVAMECVDLSLGRLLKGLRRAGAVAMITADHGNADEMYEYDKRRARAKVDSKTGLPQARTAHTLNPVPFVLWAPGHPELALRDDPKLQPGLANVAATLLDLLGYEAPEGYLPSLLRRG